MSRIGKKPISVPEGVEVAIQNNTVIIRGPKGQLQLDYNPKIKVEKKEDQILVSILKREEDRKALWGLTRALVANMIKGVTDGYEKKLEIVGVGYKAQLQGKKLVLNVGFSHPVEFSVPEGIEIKINANIITISGINKQLVGQVAAEIRNIKKPEPYKGKGIKYIDEHIRRKTGKKAGVAGGGASS